MTPDEIAELRRVVSVKPLEWTGRNVDGTIHIAHAIPIEYWVWEIAGCGYWSWGTLSGREVDGGMEGAKAAAQSDYEQRILSALTLASRALPAAPDVGEEKPVGWQVYEPNNEYWYGCFESVEDVRPLAARALYTADQVTRIRDQAKREAYAECAELLETAALAAGSADAAASAEMIKALAEKKP